MRRLALVGIVLLLAGCASQTVPNLRTSMVPLGAADHGGYGTTPWTIHVEDPWGVPQAAAPVVAYWRTPCGQDACDRVLQYVLLRTDAQGRASLLTPAGQNVTFVASSAGHSEEWLLEQRGRGDVTLYVFPPHANATFDLTWNTATATMNGLAPACQLMDFSLGGKASPAQWIRHTVDADVTVTWENGLDGIADLEVRYLPPNSGADGEPGYCPGAVADPSPSALMLGRQSSTMHISKGQMEAESWDVQSIPAHLFVGPVARGPAVGVALPYTMTISANLEHYPFGDQVKHFDGFRTEEIRTGEDNHVTTDPRDNATNTSAPAAGILVLVGLLLASAWRRRPGRGA